MTSASMTFGRPTRLTIPRGSLWVANIAHFVIQRLRQLDDWLLSLNREEAKTPEEVLAWAHRIEKTEPGFAADLRAAAMRAMGAADH